MKDEYIEWANLTLKITSVFDTKNLWRVPGIAANTLQPVEIVLVEDLGRAHNEKRKLSDFLCLHLS